MRALHHLAIVVSDLDRAERFYCGVLGLPLLRRWNDDQGAPRSLWLALGALEARDPANPDKPLGPAEGGAFLAIERAEAVSPQRIDQAPGIHCLAFRIARHERQAHRIMLEEAGFPVERESPYTLYVRDPDGNLLAFSHHPDLE